MKSLIKRCLTYLANPISMLKIAEVGRHIYIGKGLHVDNGKGVYLRESVRLGRNCRISCYDVNKRLGKITIEDNCYICDHFSALAGGDIQVGSHTLVASYVCILAENHGMDPESGVRYGLQELTGKPTIIGSYCWLGEKCIIMPGVSVGDWSIIGAGAVVTKDVPPYSIAVGNPAKIIKRYNFEIHSWEKVNSL